MAAHRDFDARPRTAPPSGSFDLGGVTWKIRARTEVPYALVQRMVAGDDEDLAPVQLDPEEFAKLSPEEQLERATQMRSRGRRVIEATDDFFAATIDPDQVEDFLKLVHDPKGPFTVDLSSKVAAHISSCLFGGGEEEGEEEGPTNPSGPSRSGRRATGSTSKAGSSSRGKQKVRSAS